MAWYWWLILAIAAFFIVRSMFSGGARKATPEKRKSPNEWEFLDKRRQQIDTAWREMAKVVALVEALPILEPVGLQGTTVTRDKLADSIEKFMVSKLLLEWNSSTKMVHVVGAPTKITLFVKLRPTEPAAAMRIYSRIGDDAWSMATRHVEEMDRAVVAADREALSAT